jgi:hypothetical protein
VFRGWKREVQEVSFRREVYGEEFVREVQGVSFSREIAELTFTRETAIISFVYKGEDDMLAMPETEKQPWESFVPYADFGDNMTASETISIGDSSATITDVDGVDQTASMLSSIQVLDRTKLAARLSGGTESGSPYKITFRVKTSNSNKWEKDVQVRVIDL